MTREELFSLHETLTAKALSLMKKKNEDYSRGSALGNFFVAEALQAASAENGIIIRLSDKLSRLVSVLEKGMLVEESVNDTIVDIINYAVLLYAVHMTKKMVRERKKPMPITPDQLDEMFTYHPPDETTVQRYVKLREGAHQFATLVVALTPPCADQTAAVRKIREAVMTANAAIALGGKV